MVCGKLGLRKKTGPHVQGIAGKRVAQNRGGLGLLAEFAKNHRVQVARVQAFGIRGERALDVIERQIPLAAACSDFGERMVRRSAPRCVPCGFRKCIAGSLIVAEEAQCKAEIVVGLAIARVGVAPRQAGDGRTEMPLRLGKFPAAQAPQAHCIVRSRIACIAP